MLKYNSPIGPMYIQKLNDGRYGLVYDDTVWESSHSPQAEADNVYTQCTGCSDWDMFDTSNIDIPSDLSEWEHC